jgi:hypothetical protein
VTAGSLPACCGTATARKGPLSAIGEALGRLPSPRLTAAPGGRGPCPIPGSARDRHPQGRCTPRRAYRAAPGGRFNRSHAPPRQTVKGPWLRAALVRPHQPLDRPPYGRRVLATIGKAEVSALPHVMFTTRNSTDAYLQ